jgi:hypothetical protein
MKLNHMILVPVLAIAGLCVTADSAKAQFYSYGYNYGAYYNPGFFYNPGIYSNPYVFSNAYNPMTTSWPSMALYNNFYNQNRYSGSRYYGSYYQPYNYGGGYRYGYRR